MASELPLERRYDILLKIHREAHFEWRRAVLRLCPELDGGELVKAYWTEVGIDTAKAYLKRIDVTKSVPLQLAKMTEASSIAMGESAEARPGDSADEAWLVHEACPWCDYHGREGLLAEDQPGCDRWFSSMLEEINATLGDTLGGTLQFETKESLPAGGKACTRRFWLEPK